MVPPANHGRDRTIEPVPAHQQAPDAGRKAHDLVERERGEVRTDPGHVEAVGGREGRHVDQHVPACGMGLVDEVEGMLHAGEVGLGREGQQVAGAGSRGLQDPAHRRSVESQFRRRHRNIDDLGALAPGKLPDAVNRVVVVRGQRERAAGRERGTTLRPGAARHWRWP